MSAQAQRGHRPHWAWVGEHITSRAPSGRLKSRCGNTVTDPDKVAEAGGEAAFYVATGAVGKVLKRGRRGKSLPAPDGKGNKGVGSLDDPRGTAPGKFEIVPYSGQPTPGAWPGNRGILGSSSKVTLEPGTVVDQYGFRGGTFVSPQGTPFPMRGLPDETLSKPFEAYRVRTALEVDGGLAAPAFGKPGLGTQYELPFTVDELIQLKVLEPIAP